jgi:PPOX class probable F420-dependent enzyme
MMLNLENSRHAHVAERLREDKVIWLVSVRPDGRPHAVVVWFVWDEAGGNVLVFSKPDQQKTRNIGVNPQVVLAMDDSREGSDPITLEGRAELVDDPDLSAAMPAYVEKYEEMMRRTGLHPPEKMAGLYSQAIRIELRRVM